MPLLYYTAFFIVLWVVWRWFRSLLRVSKERRAVFITGCDTGFGNMLVKHLDKQGVHVFATCLTAQGVSSLSQECSQRVTAIRADVTSEKEMETAAAVVQEKLSNEKLQLWGVVNNAGIVDGFLIDLTPISSYRRTFDVNVMGAVITTRLLLPLLKKSQGRLVNVGSLAGRMTATGLSGYGASKFAIEGFSDSLRRELASWGIKVSIIEPGFMKTPMVANSTALSAKFIASAPQSLRDEYGTEFFEEVMKLQSHTYAWAEDPSLVIRAIDDALFTRFPKHRYPVGILANVLVWASFLPSELVDFVNSLIAPRPKMNGM